MQASDPHLHRRHPLDEVFNLGHIREMEETDFFDKVPEDPPIGDRTIKKVFLCKNVWYAYRCDCFYSIIVS